MNYLQENICSLLFFFAHMTCQTPFFRQLEALRKIVFLQMYIHLDVCRQSQVQYSKTSNKMHHGENVHTVITCLGLMFF